MEMISKILDWLSENYDLLTMILVLGVGLFSYYVDSGQMRAKKLLMEARWARWIGLIYIFGSLGLWILLQIMLRLFGMR